MRNYNYDEVVIHRFDVKLIDAIRDSARIERGTRR